MHKHSLADAYEVAARYHCNKFYLRVKQLCANHADLEARRVEIDAYFAGRLISDRPAKGSGFVYGHMLGFILMGKYKSPSKGFYCHNIRLVYPGTHENLKLALNMADTVLEVSSSCESPETPYTV